MMLYALSKKFLEKFYCAVVVDVEAEVGVGGGGVHGGPHVLRYVIDFRSAMLLLRLGIESTMS